MKYISSVLIVSAMLLSSCITKTVTESKIQDNTKYVNTFIGTGGNGHVFPGAISPYGMVQLSPDTRITGWGSPAGYHDTDSSIMGFSHTHLSGTGIGDLGDFLFMPFSGEAKIIPGSPENPDEGYRSRFSHDSEKTEPGYYSVLLKDYNIKAELTASERVGFHRYTFNKDGKSGIIIDLSHTIKPDRNPNHEFKIISDTEISGYKGSGGWAEKQDIWFNAKFSKPFSCKFYDSGKLIKTGSAAKSKHLVAVLTFDNLEGKELVSKVGISYVDYEGAKKNLEKEISGWDFGKVRKFAKQLWAKELNRIQTEGGSDDEKTIFYTSLYHMAISPFIFSDVDGRYRGMDQKIHQANGRTIYTVFSLWDTFRAVHPLLTIVDPERNNEFIQTLLTKYDHGGTLPMWELIANYTGCMIGYHSVPVIVDAYFKGIRNFDVEKAYAAMLQAADYNVDGVLFPSEGVKKQLMPKAKLYNAKLGYIPSDLESQSVSKALEFAYNDWCIAQMAKDLGKTEDYNRFMERSSRYSKYYDKVTGFMRGKTSDGKWSDPFNPYHYLHYYTEGNAYHWSWFVPQDVDGLIKLVGGKDKFVEKLDTVFTFRSDLVGENVSGDIRRITGQYNHGNEPSHHIAYMYNFAGESWKTQEICNSIMSEMYFNKPNGLVDNDDCGQMSAWYVLNAMGFYSFCPGEPVYSIGRPIFNKVKINLSNGKVFTVVAKNNSHNNMYIQTAKLNGKPLDKPFFTHESILNGGILEFEMGASPNKNLFR